MTPFWLALVSGFAHASWNALARTPGKERAATLTALIVAFCAAGVQAAVTGGGTLTAAHGPWVLLAGLGEAAYVYSLGMAYARGDLALTYTVSRAAALVFIWPASFVAFGTAPSPFALAGTALVCLGIVLVRKPAESGVARWHPLWTLATGASEALYHTGYKGAVAGGATQVLAFIAALTIAIPVLWALVGEQVRSEVPPLLRRPKLLSAGVLCASSFLLMLAALSTAESGRILGVRNSSVGFALVFALLQGERLNRRQGLGLAVLFAGVATFGLEPPQP